MCRLHHDEPRLRRQDWAPRQLEGPVQTHLHDGAQLRPHRWGVFVPPFITWVFNAFLHEYNKRYIRMYYRVIPWHLTHLLKQNLRNNSILSPLVSDCRWSCTPRASSPVKLWRGRWLRCISCAASSFPSRTTTTSEWEPSNPFSSWQGTSIDEQAEHFYSFPLPQSDFKLVVQSKQWAVKGQRSKNRFFVLYHTV